MLIEPLNLFLTILTIIQFPFNKNKNIKPKVVAKFKRGRDVIVMCLRQKYL